MNERIACLAAFTEAIVAGHADLFDPAVRLAYCAAACPSDLIAAVDIARSRAEIPAPVVGRAYAAVHDWQWMAARRVEPRRQLGSQTA